MNGKEIYTRYKSLFYDDIMDTKMSPDGKYIAVYASKPTENAIGHNLMVFEKDEDGEPYLIVCIPSNSDLDINCIKWSESDTEHNVTFTFTSKWGNFHDIKTNLTPGKFELTEQSSFR